MIRWPIKKSSLLWRVLLATSVATVGLFTATAYLIANFAIGNSERSVSEETQASLHEFELLWRTRADGLARMSRLLSTMSDVRGAFSTRDPATIRDTAAELWARATAENSLFRVFDPEGVEIASLDGKTGGFPGMQSMIRNSFSRFPEQASGFLLENGRLYYTIFTPVYVASGSGAGLLNVLVTGFSIDDAFARNLSRMSAGSDFLFSAGARTVASTLPGAITERSLGRGKNLTAWVGETRYAALAEPLLDLRGEPVGQLTVLRSLAVSDQRFRELKRQIAFILAIAILLAVSISYLLARHILEPIQEFDAAAAEIARGNYDYRLAKARDDELGRLARTFNSMCDSIQTARNELISQERLNTIGRLSSSIVHDLRNPLAAIYGGSEMLVDNENLLPQQSRRLAMSIYKASRRIQEMLRTLSDGARGKAEPIESCRLVDIVMAARDALTTTADKQETAIVVDVPEAYELPVDRARIERVFLNLIGNSLEATGRGGLIRITAQEKAEQFVVEIDDTGVGVAQTVRSQLFLPFVTHGKKHGLGLGLAVSRQALVDHGGDLWLADKDGQGACFRLRLPKRP